MLLPILVNSLICRLVRAGEANQLRWTDVDFERNVVRIIPEKGSRPRIFNMSPKLVNKLSALRKRSMPSDPNRIFSKLLRTIRRLYMMKRKRLATLYNNPKAPLDTFPHPPPLEGDDALPRGQGPALRAEVPRPQEHLKHHALHTDRGDPLQRRTGRIRLQGGEHSRGGHPAPRAGLHGGQRLQRSQDVQETEEPHEPSPHHHPKKWYIRVKWWAR